MTDARLPERYLMDRRVMRLSDTAFRSFVVSMLWSVSNRTDGEVLPEDFTLIPGFGSANVTTLEAAGLWTRRGPGWLIVDFASTQTSRHDLEVLESARRRDREKKARQRARRPAEASADEAPAEADVGSAPGDVPGDVSRGTTQDRTGRKGQAKYLGDSLDEVPVESPVSGGEGEGEADYWPVASIPGAHSPAPASPRSLMTCRLCAQESNHIDQFGLCQKVTPDHQRARKAA